MCMIGYNIQNFKDLIDLYINFHFFFYCNIQKGCLIPFLKHMQQLFLFPLCGRFVKDKYNNELNHVTFQRVELKLSTYCGQFKLTLYNTKPMTKGHPTLEFKA